MSGLRYRYKGLWRSGPEGARLGNQAGTPRLEAYGGLVCVCVCRHRVSTCFCVVCTTRHAYTNSLNGIPLPVAMSQRLSVGHRSAGTMGGRNVVDLPRSHFVSLNWVSVPHSAASSTLHPFMGCICLHRACCPSLSSLSHSQKACLQASTQCSGEARLDSPLYSGNSFASLLLPPPSALHLSMRFSLDLC